jgi:hypothetical protein
MGYFDPMALWTADALSRGSTGVAGAGGEEVRAMDVSVAATTTDAPASSLPAMPSPRAKEKPYSKSSAAYAKSNISAFSSPPPSAAQTSPSPSISTSAAPPAPHSLRLPASSVGSTPARRWTTDALAEATAVRVVFSTPLRCAYINPDEPERDTPAAIVINAAILREFDRRASLASPLSPSALVFPHLFTISFGHGLLHWLRFVCTRSPMPPRLCGTQNLIKDVEAGRCALRCDSELSLSARYSGHSGFAFELHLLGGELELCYEAEGGRSVYEAEVVEPFINRGAKGSVQLSGSLVSSSYPPSLSVA